MAVALAGVLQMESILQAERPACSLRGHSSEPEREPFGLEPGAAEEKSVDREPTSTGSAPGGLRGLGTQEPHGGAPATIENVKARAGVRSTLQAHGFSVVPGPVPWPADEEKTQQEDFEGELGPVVMLIKEALGDRVEKAAIGDSMANSPCVLTALSNDQRIMQPQAPTAASNQKPTMRINPKHADIIQLRKQAAAGAHHWARALIWVLFYTSEVRGPDAQILKRIASEAPDP